MTRNFFLSMFLVLACSPAALADFEFGPAPNVPPPPPSFGYPFHHNPGDGDCEPGQTVWTSSGSEGQIQAAFPNGQVSVKIGYGNYTMDRSQLAVRGCSRGLCSDDSVVTSSGSQGTINGVFQNGTFSVKIGYGNYQLDRSQLASTRPDPYSPPGLIQVGQEIWTSSGSEGTVAGLFPNGTISVKIGYGLYQLDRSQLAVQGCLGNLCSNDSVITSSGSRGTVNGIFPDNRTVSVKIGYGNYQLDYSQLAKTWQ